MRANRKRKKPEPTAYIRPTAEQQAKGDFVTAGMAYRRVPVIVTLADAGKLSQRQFDGLARYRDVAIADERSLIRDSIGKMLDGMMGGGAGGPSLSTTRNAIELGYLERELGSLADIARAVAVEDVSLAQWAIRQGGSIMRSKGLVPAVVTWFEPRRKFAEIALMEIRMAGERLAAAIGA
jgi:hypothetical protein